MITLNKDLILKTTFTAVSKLQSHINGEIQFEEGKFNREDIDFIVQNYTVFHLYALNEEKLRPIVNYFIENNPKYLVAIVTQSSGHFETSPIEIAQKGGNVATIKIFLEALANIGEDHLSNRFYRKIPEMIKDGIRPVQGFLEKCTFQTIQMKNMIYLSMRKSDDTILIPHSSCIISKDFLNAHTNLRNEDIVLKKTQVELQIDKDRIENIEIDIKRREKRLHAKDIERQKVIGANLDDRDDTYAKNKHANQKDVDDDEPDEPEEDSDDEDQSDSDSNPDDDEDDEPSNDEDDSSDNEEEDNEGGRNESNEDSNQISRDSDINHPNGPFDHSSLLDHN